MIDAFKLVSTAKVCRLYVIGFDKNDNNSVYVTKIWDSKEDHDNFLKIEGVALLIKRTLPMLDGRPTKEQQLEIMKGKKPLTLAVIADETSLTKIIDNENQIQDEKKDKEYRWLAYLWPRT